MYSQLNINTPVISFIGYSGSGKTTIIEKLIHELKLKGVKLAVLKHDAHKIEFDKPGKDTYRFYEAGADSVAISSSENYMYIKKTNKDEMAENILNSVILSNLDNHDIDLIIIEGFRNSSFPKIGVCRKVTKKGLSLPLSELAAVASDYSDSELLGLFNENHLSIPHISIDDINSITDFIYNTYVCSETLVENPVKSNNDFKVSVSFDEALTIMDNFYVATKTEKIHLNNSFGRILSNDIVSDEQIPPFDRSPLDGYTFRAEDTFNATDSDPVTLEIIEEIPAGTFPEKIVQKGQASKILTGGPIPEGADAVCMFEKTEFTDTSVTIFSPFQSGENIVHAGEDIDIGDTITEKGTVINAPVAGLLASVGKNTVSVYKRPVISLISTGSELLTIDDELLPGKIRNSSAYTLSCYVEQTGAKVNYKGNTVDSPEAIASAVRESLTYSDMVITTGGVSVGDYDFLIDAMKIIGAKILFWKVRIKPGMAILVSDYNGKMILSLSGNPGSAAMTLRMLGIPFIKKLCGMKDTHPQKITAIMTEKYRKKSPTRRFMPGKLSFSNERVYFTASADIGNGAVSNLRNTDAIAVFPEGSDGIPAGTIVDVFLV